MRLTQPDIRIGKPVFAVNLQAFPTGPALDSLCGLQSALFQAVAGRGIYMCPRDSLHLTVLPIIWARGSYKDRPDKVWNSVSKDVIRLLSRNVDRYLEFSITFDDVLVSEQAIYLRYSKTEKLDDLRRTLSNIIKDVDLEIGIPTITHTTLLRFNGELSLDDLEDGISNVSVRPHEWTISSTALSIERRYPSLLLETLLELPLN